MLDTNKIIKKYLPENQYYSEEINKTQIYIHHTAGGSNPYNVISGWAADEVRIGTAFIIAGKPSKQSIFNDGDIVQAFYSKNWAYHLGLKKEVFVKNNVPYQSLDKISVGIEICNWGQVTKTDKGWETYVGSTIPENEVVEYSTPFRGYRHYHKYTDAQIQAVGDLIIYLGNKYSIPTKFIGMEMFDINLNALKGTPGVYTHVSVREDKNDCNPQQELINMLTSL